MQLVGLTGYAGSGKDELADVLVTSELKFVKLGFADPMYSIAEHIDPLLQYGIAKARLSEILEDNGGQWVLAKKAMGVRKFLQDLGESARRYIGQDVWVNALRARIDPNRNTVITNVRHVNEAEMVKSLGGVIIKVERPGFGPINGHVSDSGQAFRFADFVLVNDGDKAKWRATVKDHFGLTE